MSNIVWAMATLGRSRHALLERCAQEALRRGFASYAPQAISNLVWGFATLEYCNVPFLTVRRPSACGLPCRRLPACCACSLCHCACTRASRLHLPLRPHARQPHMCRK